LLIDHPVDILNNILFDGQVFEECFEGFVLPLSLIKIMNNGEYSFKRKRYLEKLFFRKERTFYPDFLHQIADRIQMGNGQRNIVQKDVLKLMGLPQKLLHL